MPMKDQTRREPNDPMEVEPPVKTSRLGCAPSLDATQVAVGLLETMETATEATSQANRLGDLA